MKPAAFEYRVPDSLEEALDILHENGSEAKLLAGGQSLVPAMNFRVVQPAMLIDLNRVQELAYIQQDGHNALQIGAMTRERQLEFDPTIPARAPLLAEAMPHVAHPQIRNRGTLGGSLVNADPAAELPVIMVALGARLKVRSTDGERWVAARDFFLGMFSTDLAPEEILVEVELPPTPPRTGWSFLEVAPRAGDYALMGVAVLVTLDAGGRIEKARLVSQAGDGPVVADGPLGPRHAATERSRSGRAREPAGDRALGISMPRRFQRHLLGCSVAAPASSKRREAGQG
jgi:carbon-monoxide dehydrogenase medium subunit